MTEPTKNLGRSATAQHWKDTLKVPAEWADEIDAFETEVFLRKNGKIEEKIFAETRLRRGVYGQRYDNGKRHDGKEARPISFPCGDLTKGPNTVWDAPGMQRIKIPWGGLSTEQLEVLADLAEEYSDSILHVTTRQDFQLHFIHIEDTPSIFRRLAAVGITTREACGNSVRNVTQCPLAGVCHEEAFDTTPYADALFRYLLGHPDVQDFGRKFKPAFSGCKQNPCSLTNMHDLGLIASIRKGDGKEKRGFEYYVGGGLGAVPHHAKLLDEFIPEEELLPITQAVCRIFARHGEKKNRNRARIKFLVADWGIEKFREEVFKERKTLPTDPRWTDFLKDLHKLDETPLKPISNKGKPASNPELDEWLLHNVRTQKQSGYCTVSINLPLGDLTSNQARDLAKIAQKYVGDGMSTTVEQNILFRWVRREDLENVHTDLRKIGLADPVANTIIDITACPGTDTCKLGNASSRGLAGELRVRLAEKSLQMDSAIRDLKIKISGCFNSCGQHHLADIGFYGISRKKEGRVVPHFQLVIGGQWTQNGGSYGLAVCSIPSKAVPKTIDRIAEIYLKGREKHENFQGFIRRYGKVALKQALMDLTEIPSYEKDPFYYVDWADVREFTTSDIGVGECAGEVVSLVDFGLTAADREIFEAQIKLDAGNLTAASKEAYRAMITAAQALIKGENPDISKDEALIINEFKTRFCDTEKFYDPFAGSKFANYLFRMHGAPYMGLNAEQVRQRIEEAQLFIEAAYSCNVRMSMQS